MPDLSRTATEANIEPLAIPVWLNIGIGTAAAAVAIACLWLASHAPHWSVLVGAACVFSFANNTIFSLLHECVHGSFHPNRRRQ